MNRATKTDAPRPCAPDPQPSQGSRSGSWPSGLPFPQATIKRTFDIVGAVLGLAATIWIILPAVGLARLDTGSSGLFRQRRLGRHGKSFNIYKIRTMRPSAVVTTKVTTTRDVRITKLGHFFRATKLDELPQLWNILIGDMSFVGPRPDVPEMYDLESEEDKVVLSVRPGITGPASLKYRHEEEFLSNVDDAERYNAEVIFPDKLRINIDYIENYAFGSDLRYIWRTIFDGRKRGPR